MSLQGAGCGDVEKGRHVQTSPGVEMMAVQRRRVTAAGRPGWRLA